MTRTHANACPAVLPLLVAATSRGTSATLVKDPSCSGHDVTQVRQLGGTPWRARDSKIITQVARGEGVVLLMPGDRGLQAAGNSPHVNQAVAVRPSI